MLRRRRWRSVGCLGRRNRAAERGGQVGGSGCERGIWDNDDDRNGMYSGLRMVRAWSGHGGRWEHNVPARVRCHNLTSWDWETSAMMLLGW